MKSLKNNAAFKNFVRNILGIDIVMIIIANLLAWLSSINFGMILLLIGILVGGLGAFLGSPDPTDPSNPRNLPFQYINRPNERLQDQETYNAEHSAPKYAFENVMTFAGLIAVLLSIPFLVHLMYLK